MHNFKLTLDDYKFVEKYHQWHALAIYFLHIHSAQSQGSQKTDEAFSNAAYSLLIPGKILNLSALNSQKKFRDRGNKQGAKKGWQLLEDSGLGKLHATKAVRGTDMVCAIKYDTITIYKSF